MNEQYYLESENYYLELNRELNQINTEFIKYKNNRRKFQQSKTSFQYTVYKYRFAYWSLLGFLFSTFIVVFLTKIASEISTANFILNFIIVCIFISLCMVLVFPILAGCNYIYESYKTGKSNDAKANTDSLYKYQDYFLGIKIGKSTSNNSCIAYKKNYKIKLI